VNPLGVFNLRVRGFRVLDVAAVSLILVIALGSYALKTFASAEDADANGVETRIVEQEKRIRLLKAEIAGLEEPRRVEDLSTRFLGLAAVDASHEIAPRDLARIAAPPPAVAAPVRTPAP
jgi:hypothetical protein